MRYRGMSITMLGAALLLLTLAAADASAQRGRLGVLRPAPRPQIGFGAGRPRVAVIAPSFFNACFVVPSVPFFGGGLPFLNIQIFAGGQPSPDPNSHLAPDPSAQPVPFPGSHPMPGVQPVPGANAVTNPPAMPAFAAPVYSAPVYSAPVYGGAAPATMPQVSGGMVIGQTIDDPTFGLRGSSFFGGVACVSRRSLSRTVFIR